MPALHVALEQRRGGLGVELVVQVVAARLVLDEGGRVRELADVVVVGRDAGEQRVAADRLGRALGEVPDHQRVVVRARASRRAGAGAAAGTGSRARAAGTTVRIPNTDPMTAKLPDRRDRRAARRRRPTAPRSWSTPQGVLVAQQRERRSRRGRSRRTRRCPPGRTPRGGRRAGPRRCRRSRRTARSRRARAPVPLTAAASTAMSAVMIIATPASSSTVTSIPTAASGSAYGQPRPAGGQLEREHGEQQQQAQQQQDVVAMPELAPEAPGPGRAGGRSRARQHDEADEPGDVEAALVEAEVVDRLERDVVDAVADADDGLAASPSS